MSLTPSAKRRRLEDAQSALRKPFRSPFKTPSRKLDTPSADMTHSSTAVPSPLAQEGDATALPDDGGISSKSSKASTLRNSRSSTTLSSTTTPSKTRTPFSPRRTAPNAAAIAAEEQRQRQLGRQIREARAELDTLTQALAFSTSTKDAELEALTRKWRDATRAAAEEVFAGARERVDGMGGVGAPEEREARLMAREQRADARAEARNERRWRKRQWANEEGLAMEETQKPPGGGEEDEEDESFTMDTMLKTLNIDPEMLGWDKEGQRWVD